MKNMQPVMMAMMVIIMLLGIGFAAAGVLMHADVDTEEEAFHDLQASYFEINKAERDTAPTGSKLNEDLVEIQNYPSELLRLKLVGVGRMLTGIFILLFGILLALIMMPKRFADVLAKQSMPASDMDASSRLASGIGSAASGIDAAAGGIGAAAASGIGAAASGIGAAASGTGVVLASQLDEAAAEGTLGLRDASEVAEGAVETAEAALPDPIDAAPQRESDMSGTIRRFDEGRQWLLLQTKTGEWYAFRQDNLDPSMTWGDRLLGQRVTFQVTKDPDQESRRAGLAVKVRKDPNA